MSSEKNHTLMKKTILPARFDDLFKMKGGRLALAFIAAQVFNILWTLLWAYLIFGGILFPSPDIK